MTIRISYEPLLLSPNSGNGKERAVLNIRSLERSFLSNRDVRTASTRNYAMRKLRRMWEEVSSHPRWLVLVGAGHSYRGVDIDARAHRSANRYRLFEGELVRSEAYRSVFFVALHRGNPRNR